MGSGLLGEHASGVGTVLLHGGANLVELGSVVVGHGPKAAVVGSLVGVDEALKLGILLQVLLVPLVTDLDHTVHLGPHVGVHLGLSELVLVDDTGQLGDASVGLGDLLLHGGTEGTDLHTEEPLGRSHTGSGLLAGVRNPLNVSREPLVVQSLGGVEGSGHVSGGSLKGEIGVLAVTSHAGTDAAEASGGLGDHNLEPVVGPLASGLALAAQLGSELGATLGGESLGVVGLVVELVHSVLERLGGGSGVGLDLGSVHQNRLVGLLDARVDRGCVSGLGTLLGRHLVPEVPGGLGPVLRNLAADGRRLANVHGITVVRKAGSLGEPPLSVTHGLVQIVRSLAGVVRHATEESLLELAARARTTSRCSEAASAAISFSTLRR